MNYLFDEDLFFDNTLAFDSDIDLFRNSDYRKLEKVLAFEEEIDPIIIPPDDTRRKVRNTKVAPFRYICSIERISPGGISRVIGTGTLIGPRSILTAAHVVYGKSASHIQVTPARNRSKKPFGKSPAAQLIPNPKYVSYKSTGTTDKRKLDAQDYAVIHLQKTLGNIVGYWGQKPVPSFDIRGTRVGGSLPFRAGVQKVNLSGYPEDKSSGTEQWRAFNETVELSKGILYYLNDTTRGMSGSPVWIKRSKWKGGRIMVGIHGGAGTPTSSSHRVNRAAFIDKNALKFIHKYRI